MNKEDTEFVKWWENHRKAEGDWKLFLKKGIGMGLMLSFPIVLTVIFRGWYKRMPFVSGTQLVLIIIACLIVSFFYALLKGRMQWEQREERYKQLKSLSSITELSEDDKDS